MKPKLWDGANAVGEARERALQQVDAPYLTASGPGFTARKMGQFSEVTGVEPTSPTSEVTNWWSASNNASTMVLVTGAATYKHKFRSRGRRYVENTDHFSSGTMLDADGAGKGYQPQWDYSADGYSHYSALITSNGGRTAKVIFSYPACEINTQLGFSLRAISTGASYFRDSQGPYAVLATTTGYNAGDGWGRTKPVIIGAAKTGSGWVTWQSDCPWQDGDDTAAPCLAVLGPTRLAVMYAPTALTSPKLYVSDNLGVSWSAGSDMAGLYAGAPLKVDGWGDPIDVSMTDYPHSEEWFKARPYPPDQQRALYLQELAAYMTPQIDSLGGRSFGFAPVSRNKVVVSTSYPVWPGGVQQRIAVAAVVDVTNGSMTRTEFPHYWTAGTRTLGRGCWVLWLADYDGYYLRITTDFGATYFPPTPPGAIHGVFAIKYFDHPPRKYLIGFLVDDGTGVAIYTTDDFVTYTRQKTVGTAEQVGRPLTGNDFTAAVDIGTPARPGLICPEAPWTRDPRIPTPAWWNE